MTYQVVIVDDSLTVRMNLRDAFRSADFDTVECISAAEARAAIARHVPDLVILDVLLPDANGVDLLAELRDGDTTSLIPVILLSTESEVKDRIHGLKRGADEYVGKPYDPGYVVARATTLLRRRDGKASTDLTVLVIDDSATFREALSAMLRDVGYQVLTGASGEEGLRRAADARPHAIIVDGIMPDLDGATVLRRIRLDPGLSATPCLLMTASEGAASEVAALDAGADAYVRKTEGPAVVLARLAAAIRAAEESRARVSEASLLGPKRILAVDDSVTYLEELATHLQQDGYEVVKARSGEEALELLAVEDVDCVLLDLMMPGVSGTEACRRMKGSPRLQRMPVIMLTSVTAQEAMVDAINAGADDFVAKGENFEVLRARLRAQLRRKQFEDENRRVRDQLLRKDAERDSAQRIADARKALLEELSRKNEELSTHTAELQRLNQEMQTFAYSVSHDLRQPLRSMAGFSQILLEEYSAMLDERGRHFLSRVRSGAVHMGLLVDGLLALSRVSRKPIETKPVRLDAMAHRIIARFREAEPNREVETRVQTGIEVSADPALMESMLENLIGNAWKFTSKTSDARLEIASTESNSQTVYFVRDNGAGFDMAYADKLFGPFQRLHAASEFEGTGIGLATVQRIVHRHGGRIWAESAPGQGATFLFTVPSIGDPRAPE
ncbi:MAG TPA: response regulator [Polyangia bacterium]|jgi:DNA-binding response OmpR family regulator